MMKRIKRGLRWFFLPGRQARWYRWLLPFGTLAVAFVVLFSGGAQVWEYTNSPQFCGTSCHTMPPEYTAYQTSPHARILCVECHIGRDFMGGGFVLRKAGDLKHVVATITQNYQFPMRADEMRPARETCERCHSPDKFSDDKLKEIKRFGTDPDNTPTSIYLTMKTGGGNARQGLGRGIHWHIQSQVYYLPTDSSEQQIPYVKVVNEDGTTSEYVDIQSGLDPRTIDPSQLKEMDCITCHNRITHLVSPPDDRVDQMLARKLVDPTIPEIRLRAASVLSATYGTIPEAMDGIAALKSFYQTTYPEYYTANSAKIDATIATLQEDYQNNTFPEQKSDWTTHPNNVGHRDTPGCFRCHDGKHLNDKQEAIRLECNLCHSIPVVVGPDKFVADIEISRGPEPESHLNPNWLGLHHSAFDETCAACHTTGNAGGTDNSSFCSNSACHGSGWQYAGLNAPALKPVLQQQLPPTPTPAPTLEPTPTPRPSPTRQPAEDTTPAPAAEVAATPTAVSARAPTYAGAIAAIFADRCSKCHGSAAMAGLNLTTYATALKGGKDGPVIVPGDPAKSLLIQKQSGATPHFGQLSASEMQLVSDWIKAGAPEQ
jgi:nitrate/TMAO reductase-like tetraheme cytochrome c subunit/mono/diheme cytochrome c family protein